MIGKPFGDYVIEARLASGGMGEVYRAHDGKLNRPVALKLLDERLNADPEYVRRFIREAQHAAGLSHPNIATIYAAGETDGRRWLAMEYLEGETLAEQLHRTPRIPHLRALEWGAQLADGLAAAHRKGLVHRDIKPGNLMILPDGRLKILDFGLAKPEGGAMRTEGPQPSPHDATRDLVTAAGTIVGTVAYMSPEQARGDALDRRSDIFSAGIVLYELLAGRNPFRGKSTAETLGNLLYHHPEPPRLDSLTTDSGELARILRKALAKDRDARYQHADELAVDLRGVRRMIDSGASALTAPASAMIRAPLWPRVRRPLITLGWVAAGALLGVAGVFLWFGTVHHGARFTATEKPDVTLLTRDASIQEAAVISPDGKSIAFQSDRTGPFKIFVRAIGSTQTVQITTGDDADTHPLYSPDGALIAYESSRRADDRREIRVVPALGGNSRKLLEDARAFAFFPDGRALLVTRCAEGRCGLWKLPLGGETITLVRELPVAEYNLLRAAAINPADHALNYILNDLAEGRGGLYEIDPERPEGPATRLAAFRNEFGTAIAYGNGGRRIYFSASNQQANFSNIYHYERGSGTLKAVTGGANINLYPSVSRDGRRLVYSSWNEIDLIARIPLAGRLPVDNRQLDLLTLGRVDDEQPAYSRDGRLIAYVSDLDGNYNLWIAEPATGEHRQVTFGADSHFSPVFSADGRELYHYANPGGKTGLYSVPVDGGPLRLITDRLDLLSYLSYTGPPSVSPDGKTIALPARAESGQTRIHLVPAAGGDPRPLGNAAGLGSAWSPDGRALYTLAQEPDAGKRSVDSREPTAIWKFALDGAGTRLPNLPEGLVEHYLSSTADGRWLYFIRESHPGSHARQVWRYDLRNQRAEPVTAFTLEHPRFGIAVAPDGRTLALSLNRVDSNIVLLDGIQK